MKRDLVSILRPAFRKIIPNFILNIRSRSAETKQHLKYSDLDIEEVFTRIYNCKDWGNDGSNYFSGTGSHSESIVVPYINAVSDFLSSLENKPIIVDLGSGDFNIGKKLLDFAKYYYACDIVSELQIHNSQKFNFKNVEFLHLNAISDDLPNGDVVIIRQVFQHLNNENINKVINKCYKFKYWIITEHLPNLDSYIPNKDMTNGCGVRVLYDSGVDLTKPPFNCGDYKRKILCEVPEHDGVISTALFEKTD